MVEEKKKRKRRQTKRECATLGGRFPKIRVKVVSLHTRQRVQSLLLTNKIILALFWHSLACNISKYVIELCN